MRLMVSYINQPKVEKPSSKNSCKLIAKFYHIDLIVCDATIQTNP